jgi:hypothetical protein
VLARVLIEGRAITSFGHFVRRTLVGFQIAAPLGGAAGLRHDSVVVPAKQAGDVIVLVGWEIGSAAHEKARFSAKKKRA